MARYSFHTRRSRKSIKCGFNTLSKGFSTQQGSNLGLSLWKSRTFTNIPKYIQVDSHPQSNSHKGRYFALSVDNFRITTQSTRVYVPLNKSKQKSERRQYQSNTPIIARARQALNDLLFILYVLSNLLRNPRLPRKGILLFYLFLLILPSLLLAMYIGFSSFPSVCYSISIMSHFYLYFFHFLFCALTFLFLCISFVISVRWLLFKLWYQSEGWSL